MTTTQITANTTIMLELQKMALEQVASDIRRKTGSGTTAKAVKLLLMRGKDQTIVKRYTEYMAASVAAVATI